MVTNIKFKKIQKRFYAVFTFKNGFTAHTKKEAVQHTKKEAVQAPALGAFFHRGSGAAADEYNLNVVDCNASAGLPSQSQSVGVYPRQT
jgi:hypothetical protein